MNTTSNCTNNFAVAGVRVRQSPSTSGNTLLDTTRIDRCGWDRQHTGGGNGHGEAFVGVASVVDDAGRHIPRRVEGWMLVSGQWGDCRPSDYGNLLIGCP